MTDDTFSETLDQADLDAELRSRWTALWVAIGGAPVMAALVAFLIAWLSNWPPREPDRHSVPDLVRDSVDDVASWSLTPGLAGAVALGASAVLVTLFVAAALTPPDENQDDRTTLARRLVLDEVALFACFVGAVAGWLLAIAGNWRYTDEAVGGVVAASAGVFLSALCTCTPRRKVAIERRRWLATEGLARLRAERDVVIGAMAENPRLRSSTSLLRLSLPTTTVAILPVGLAVAMTGRTWWLYWTLALLALAVVLSTTFILSWLWRLQHSVQRVQTGRRLSDATILLCFAVLPCWGVDLLAAWVAGHPAGWVSLAVTTVLALGTRPRGRLSSSYLYLLTRRIRTLETELTALT